MTTFEWVQTVLSFVLGAVFIVMGVTHFLPGPARTMAAMIPPTLRRNGIPQPHTLVVFTGVCEIAGGLGLGLGIICAPLRVAAVIALVLFLIAVFPANSHAAEHPDRFGRLAIPFWPRYLGQLALIALLLALLL